MINDPADYTKQFTDDCEEAYTLKRRVAGSLMAVELQQLLSNEQLSDTDFMRGLIDRLERDTSSEPIADVADVKLEPIARLGATIMPFGKYADDSFNTIPLEYLDWLCGSQEEFYKGLRAYLTHPELKSRRGDE
jgi:uncharacterized protein (DUF3820 family)